MTFNAYVQHCSAESVGMGRDLSPEETIVLTQNLESAWVEIVENEAGATLFRFCSEGNHIADTWHENVREAKHRAEKEFGIQNEHWFEE